MKASIPFAVIAVFLPVLAVSQAVAPPPQPLHLVGDHWTPYTPPTELPEGATIHVVERGDTLWDLAKKYLGDPYLWPQIWERNPYITDSHWIYPGDPIVIDVAVQEPAAAPTGEGTAEGEGEGAEGIPGEAGPPTGVEEAVPYALGNSADVYCFARMFQDESVFPYSIRSAEAIQYQSQFSEGDILYIDGGQAEGVSAGDRFFILHRRRPLVHPASNDELGIIYDQVGQLKILCAQEHTSISEVTLACDAIEVGDRLLPFEPVPVPLVVDPPRSTRCDTPNGKPLGYVVFIKDDALNIGPENTVLVDLGSGAGLYPGQFATIFRPNPVEGMPRLVMGELGILTTYDTYSTAKITQAWAPVNVGDQVEIK